MNDELNIRQTLEKVMGLLKGRTARKLEEQGHRNTGSLENSLDYEVVYENGDWVGRMTAADYGIILEFGVKPEKIPYSGRSGRGGTSQYIQGLVKYWETKGLAQKEALRAAFATATIHKREGMPSRESFQYSRSGRRTGFITEVLKESEGDIRQLMEGSLQGVGIEIIFGDDFRSIQNEILDLGQIQI